MWISVFRGIPWMELIAAAPAIARGARKLWSGIRNPPEPAAATERGAQLAELESQVRELKKELVASSEVIKAMADQNERLLKAVGILRMRVRVLTTVGVILVVFGIAVAAKLWV